VRGKGVLNILNRSMLAALAGALRGQTSRARGSDFLDGVAVFLRVFELAVQRLDPGIQRGFELREVADKND
jgi:hypothetical protein